MGASKQQRPRRSSLTAGEAQAAWQILVEECEASPDGADDFVRYLSHDVGQFGHEYRFGGALGFGGKLYFNGYSLTVGCYPEHETEPRAAMIAAANRRLAQLTTD